jgi:uncharacterized membrane protein
LRQWRIYGEQSQVPRVSDPPNVDRFSIGAISDSRYLDLIYLVGRNTTMATIAYWMIAAGIIGALAAAPFGWIDWFAIPRGTRAKSVGLWHGAGNVVVLLLFAASWVFRHNQPEAPAALGFALSFLGAGLALVTGWLGGELVDRLSVGVNDGANINAPSSLSKRPVR